MLLRLVLGLALVAALAFYLVGQQEEPLPPLTSISYEDVLNHPALKQGMLEAVSRNDMAKVEELQAKAVEIGQAAGFDAQQMSQLEGQQSRDFLIFRAKRTLFYQDFQRAYKQLESIEPIKAKYPEAQSLFNQADQLIVQRDEAINQVALLLAQEQGEPDNSEAYLKAAQQLWRAKQQDNLQEPQ